MTQTDEPAGLQSDWPTEPAVQRKPRKRGPGFFRELPVLIIIAFGLALLMKTFLIQAFYIPSPSMEPTLHGCTSPCSGDRVLVNKLAYHFREPRRGEIIVFIAEHDTQKKSFFQKVRSFLFEGLGVTTPRETDFIKRVIGLPGETIQVTDSGVFITPPGGKKFKLSEPYINSINSNDPTAGPCGAKKGCPQGPAQAPTKVPKDTYFVMGDNRENSADSRVRGPIKRSDIIGKAFVKIWPPSRMALVHPQHYCTDARVKKTDDACKPKAVTARGVGGRARSGPLFPLPVVALAVAVVRRARTS